jgi:hypothetical protein
MTLVLPRLVCRRCRYIWTARVAEPVACPACKTRGEFEVVGSRPRPSAAILPPLPMTQGQGA